MAKEPGERYATARSWPTTWDSSSRTVRSSPGRPARSTARPSGRGGTGRRSWRRRYSCSPPSIESGRSHPSGAMACSDATMSELRSALVRTERNESLTGQLLYDSQMRLAQQAWGSGQVELAQELLEALRPESGGRDLRGFEWHYLRRMCHRDVSLLTQPRDDVDDSLSRWPDLVSGDRYGSMVFWDLVAGHERTRVQGHKQEVSGLLLSPDGRALASWSTVEGQTERGQALGSGDRPPARHNSRDHRIRRGPCISLRRPRVHVPGTRREWRSLEEQGGRSGTLPEARSIPCPARHRLSVTGWPTPRMADGWPRAR